MAECRSLHLGRALGRRLVGLACAVLVLGLQGSASAVNLHAGDLLVAQLEAPNVSILRIDPVSGVKTTVAPAQGAVNFLWRPRQVVVEPSGKILVLDSGFGRTAQEVILRIDPVTGKQTPLTSFGGGDGSGTFAIDIAVDANGNIFYAIGTVNQLGFPRFIYSIVRVDPGGGESTLASGGYMQNVRGITVDGSGNVIVISGDGEAFGGRVIRINSSGVQTLVSSDGRVISPVAVIVDVTGDYLVIDASKSLWNEHVKGVEIVRVKRDTGDQTQVASDYYGAGLVLNDLARNATGTIFGVNHVAGTVAKVNRVIGAGVQQTIATGLAHPSSIAVVQADPCGAPIEESGTLSVEIARLNDLVLAKDSGKYVTPTIPQLSALRSLAQLIKKDEVTAAQCEADKLGYELVLFTDTRNGKIYRLLREKLATTDKLGWGSYVYDRQGRSRLVEAPHPKSDVNTPQLAIEVFREAGAKGYLMAGAHRLANGGIESNPLAQLANVAAHIDSMFHVFHEEWSSDDNQFDDQTLPIQIHGFAIGNHTNFPSLTQAVISNGDGFVRGPHYDLDEALDTNGLLSFAWAKTVSNADSRINCTNTTHPCNTSSQDGDIFIDVGGNYNVQGSYTRTQYNRPFLHVELALKVRTPSDVLWQPAIEAMVKTLVMTTLVSDEDRDGIPDERDNCPAVPNADQADSGTMGSPSNLTGKGGDGIGDACQCGDMTGDGRVLGNDATLIRRWLIGLPVPPSFDASRCNVFGPAGADAAECQGNDATIMRRNLIGLAPAAALDNCFPEWSP